MATLLTRLSLRLAPAAVFACLLAACGSSAGAPARPESVPPATSPVVASTPATTPQPAGDRLYLIMGDYSPSQRLAVVDATTGARERELPYGVAAPDWSAVYTVTLTTGSGSAHTDVRAIDAGTGQTLRAMTVEGNYALPPVSIDGTAGGLSQNGRWLALAEQTAGGTPTGRSHFVLLDTSFSQPPKPIDIDGNFSFDAISNYGTGLYLIEYASADGRYSVRRYDVIQGRLDPGVIVAKGSDEVMRGNRVASVASPDGQWLYSLYIGAPSGPFIHALNLDQHGAVCIDLPASFGSMNFEQLLLSSLAMTPDGRWLYVANGALGSFAEIETSQFRVRRTNTVALGRRSSGPLDAIAGFLLPTAEAKRLVAHGAVLSPDGAMLWALGESGLVAVNTNDLSLKGRYLDGRALDGVALSPDGSRLYTVSREDSMLFQLDPATGRSLNEAHLPGGPMDIVRVEAGR